MPEMCVTEDTTAVVVVAVASYRSVSRNLVRFKALMKTHAHDMNLPFLSDARQKHDKECFTEYQTRYT